MWYYIYQVTNLINNKIYIGQHRTNNFYDGYFGSGADLRKAITEFGKENFEFTILEFFGTFAAMNAREEEIVDRAWIKEEFNYNIISGGSGEFKQYSEETTQKLRDAGKKGSAITNARTDIDWKAAQIKAHETRLRRGVYEKLPRLTLQAAKLGCNKAADVNQGTVFMYFVGIGIKRISKELIPHYIDQGWYYGSPNSKIFKVLKNL